jgi:phage terminase small subunit
MDPNPTLTPTRRLTSKERAVFDRVASEFVHLTPTDEEQITQYAEAVARYTSAAKECKKHPTISLPVVNRSTGNITGEKIVRNTSFASLKEAQTQMNSLARRLMIDAHSAEKRLRLASKIARSAFGIVASEVAANIAALSITEKQIEAVMRDAAGRYTAMSPAQLREYAIWVLTDPYLNSAPDEIDAYLFAPVN